MLRHAYATVVNGSAAKAYEAVQHQSQRLGGRDDYKAKPCLVDQVGNKRGKSTRTVREKPDCSQKHEPRKNADDYPSAAYCLILDLGSSDEKRREKA
jgi:hypothetical protein